MVQTSLADKVVVAVFLSFVSLALLGCAPTTPNSPTNDVVDSDEVFEDNHFDEMEKKNDDSQAAESVSETTSLLMPENEVDIVSEEVEYADGIMGYVSYPQDNSNAPGVVVIHEWWGLNDHIKDMTKVLAANGYTALAVDLYAGEVASSPEQARELTSAVDQEEAKQNLLAAEDWLRNAKSVSRVASLGRCFGGQQSLQLSLASESLDATVIYYGRLETDTGALASINQPILGVFAENDSGIPPAVVNQFKDALDQIDKENDITIYSGVDHAFANPTGGNFSEEETLEAWQKTLAFLEENLK